MVGRGGEKKENVNKPTLIHMIFQRNLFILGSFVKPKYFYFFKLSNGLQNMFMCTAGRGGAKMIHVSFELALPKT